MAKGPLHAGLLPSLHLGIKTVHAGTYLTTGVYTTMADQLAPETRTIFNISYLH